MQTLNAIFIVGLIVGLLQCIAMCMWLGLIGLIPNVIFLVIYGNALGTWYEEETKRCSK